MIDIQFNKECMNSINLKKTIENLSQKDTFISAEINCEIWMTENLNVSNYRNGDAIIEAISKEEWEFCSKNKIPAFCYFENDIANDQTFGKLYNYYSVLDIRNLIPKGWQIIDNLPLIESLESIFSNSYSLNVNRNEMVTVENVVKDFNPKPSGFRRSNGDFVGKNKLFRCWSEPKEIAPFYHIIKYPNSGIDLSNYFSDYNFNPGNGYSIRCKKSKNI